MIFKDTLQFIWSVKNKTITEYNHDIQSLNSMVYLHLTPFTLSASVCCFLRHSLSCLKLAILLSQPPKFWDYSCAPLCILECHFLHHAISNNFGLWSTNMRTFCPMKDYSKTLGFLKTMTNSIHLEIKLNLKVFMTYTNCF